MNASRSADLYAGTRERVTEAVLGFSPETLAAGYPRVRSGPCTT